MSKNTTTIVFSLTFALALLYPTASIAQFPQSVICQFEKTITAELDDSGKIVAGGEGTSGELVISNLNSEAPMASGNLGTLKMHVLRRSKDAISFAVADNNSSPFLDEYASVITFFVKTGGIMHTKHEIVHSASFDKPFGFVEIGRCRPLK